MYKKINKFIILYTLCFIFIIVSISIAKMAYWQERMTDEGWKEGGEEEAESLTPRQALDKKNLRFPLWARKRSWHRRSPSLGVLSRILNKTYLVLSELPHSQNLEITQIGGKTVEIGKDVQVWSHLTDGVSEEAELPPVLS